MKIKELKLDNFMIFNELDLKMSPNINVISGENSTGKTALLKIMYAGMKGYVNAYVSKGEVTKDKLESCLVNKMQGVFRPDKDSIGRLVNRRQGSNRAEVVMEFGSEKLSLGFGNRQERHIDVDATVSDESEIKKVCPVYIPPKEIISSTENFGALYDEYHIAFEETYYDLARLLEKPLRKGPNTTEQNTVMKSLEKIVDGSIIQKDKNFYLKVKGSGEFEMGLVSEGYRKLSTIMYLILSGSLSKDAILFWDEPETNMNPKMIKPLVDAVIELAKMGVQVFITTHDYFVQQCFNIAATYQKNDKKKLQYNFMSLYRDERTIICESSDSLLHLEHNAIMDEFDALYDREQGLIYGN